MSLWLHLGPDLSVSASLSPPPPGPPAGAAWRSDAIRLRGAWVPPGGLQVTLTSAVPSAAAAPPPPARTFNVPLLKSALQKAVRRSLAGTAVRLAHQLMAQDVQAFLRRIPVIMLEDSLLYPPLLQLAVFCMCATSKGFALGPGIRDALLAHVHAVAACAHRDVADAADADADAAAVVRDLSGTARRYAADEAACLLLMLVRVAYGGMPGDAQWQLGVVTTWAARYRDAAGAWREALQRAYGAEDHAAAAVAALAGGAAGGGPPPGLRECDKLVCACDFHCFPWLLGEIMEQLCGPEAPDVEAVKTAIWLHRSSVYAGKRLLARRGARAGPPDVAGPDADPEAVERREKTRGVWSRVEPVLDALLRRHRLWERPGKRVSSPDPAGVGAAKRGRARPPEPKRAAPSLKRLWGPPAGPEAVPPDPKPRARPYECPVFARPVDTAGLSAEQRSIAALLEGGGNVFCTGSAGTGKSFLLQRLLDALPTATTFVTASTGIAAVNIGGSTVHSFAGVQVGYVCAGVRAGRRGALLRTGR